jgi:uncharacterized membrane protein YebE (DUF533 family)
MSDGAGFFPRVSSMLDGFRELWTSAPPPEWTIDLFPEIDVSGLQAEAIARGLYAVALADGVHERELQLIAEFYAATTAEAKAGSAASLERSGPLDPRDVAQFLLAESHRELFMKAAFLLAWADGQVTPAERARIAEFGVALAVSVEAQRGLEAQVKDYLPHRPPRAPSDS